MIASLASAPAKAIADQGSVTEQTQDTGDPLSCSAFTANMRANYQDLYLSGPASLGASVPLVMSQMWENTGLMVWVNSQFGAGNPYGPRVYCHVLEDRIEHHPLAGVQHRRPAPHATGSARGRAAATAPSWG